MSNVLLKLIKFGIGLILFIPLYVNGSFFFPFIFPKIWLFQLITEIIFFFYIILAISDNRFRPKWNWIFGAAVILTIILILTSFTGVDVFRSFWGNTERMSGVITWFHFVVFAIILAGILKTEKEWQKFFGITVFVSVLEFFYLLAQYFGASWVWLPGSQFGTIGNTDLLGTYAIFSAFFALYLWQNRETEFPLVRNSVSNISKKGFWIAAFFLNIGTLFIASSRGAILGFFAGILAYVIFNILEKKINIKVFAPIILILLLVYGIIFSFRNTDFVKNNRQLSRVTNVSLKDDTVQQRITEWGIAWDAFKARPIFGFGSNNYLYLHNAFLNPRVYNLRETNFDRAHNAYLDYASMSGILGLLGYLFLIGTLFWFFFKNKLWVLASLVIAYAVQSFFVFDSPVSYIALFLTIGFAAYTRNTQHATRNNQIQNSTSSQVIAAVSIFYFIVSIFLIWQVSIKPAKANNEFVHAFNDSSLGPEEAFNLYKKALAQETLGTTEFRNQYITWLQKNLGNFKPEEQMAVLDFGISELEKEIEDHPMVFSYLNLGQLYNYKARGLQDESTKREFFEKAANAYNQALELSPSRLEVYYSYLQLSFDTKNYDKGIELMKRAVSHAPNYWQTHWYLGLAYTAAGKDEEAARALNGALAVFYNPGGAVMENGRLKYDYDKILNYVGGFAPKQEILGAVNPYIRLKMWPELLLLYLSAEVGDPNDIQIHQSLALVYQNLGLEDKALEELKIIRTLSEKEIK